MKKTKITNQYRALSTNIRSGSIDEESRTVELSFSSEEPVMRYFGLEILDHEPSSVDMSRLNDGAPVLVDHGGDQVGVVEEATIENKRGFARVRFSASTRGKEIFQDIVDGIRKNISFGYQILGLDEETGTDEPTFRSRNWLPFEISVVAVPADNTIGIGREMEETNEVEVPDSFRSLEEEEEIKEEVKEEIKEEGVNPRLKILEINKPK